MGFIPPSSPLSAYLKWLKQSCYIDIHTKSHSLCWTFSTTERTIHKSSTICIKIQMTFLSIYVEIRTYLRISHFILMQTNVIKYYEKLESSCYLHLLYNYKHELFVLKCIRVQPHVEVLYYSIYILIEIDFKYLISVATIMCQL